MCWAASDAEAMRRAKLFGSYSIRATRSETIKTLVVPSYRKKHVVVYDKQPEGHTALISARLSPAYEDSQPAG